MSYSICVTVVGVAFFVLMLTVKVKTEAQRDSMISRSLCGLLCVMYCTACFVKWEWPGR